MTPARAYRRQASGRLRQVAYVVGRLEGLSVTENTQSGDLLGDFFEQIVSQDFTQTRGQFFTPIKLVRFILRLADAVRRAEEIMRTDRDHLGRPRLPYMIDPSAGSGTFLIEYMKEVRAAVGAAARLMMRGLAARQGSAASGRPPRHHRSLRSRAQRPLIGSSVRGA